MDSHSEEEVLDIEPQEIPQRGLLRFFSRRPVPRITDAVEGADEYRRHRTKIYTVLQFSRIPLILLGLVCYWLLNSWVLFALLVVISIPMPWIAVVIANESRQKRDKRSAHVYIPTLIREQEAAALEAAVTPFAHRELEAGSRRDTTDKTPPTQSNES